jgi:hypothetical protein
MKFIPVRLPQYAGAFCLCAALVLTVIACGCTQQQASPAQIAPAQVSPAQTYPAQTSGVTVTKPDDSHITVAFTGAPGMETALELEITITDTQGKIRTQSLGSRLATTPVQTHATQTFTGSYSGKNHVTVTGYFSDGSHRIVLDQDI